MNSSSDHLDYNGTTMAMRSSICSHSLGRAWVHSLPTKLEQASLHGFQGIEIFHEDLEYVAKALPGGLTTANKLLAAAQIRHMCDAFSLTIVCLQPFMHYEGLLDREAHAGRIADLAVYFDLMHILGTDLMVIPSTFLPASEVSSDAAVLAADLLEAADLAAAQSPPLRIAYEALCWGTRINTWEGSWDMVQRVDRPNFGLCLDTFNIAGGIYADPAAADGKVATANVNLASSLARLKRLVPREKVFFVQVVDGERMKRPLTPEHPWHVEGQPPRMSWSRNARLFPMEEGGYLPVLEILRVVCGKEGLGYNGFVSHEVFSRSLVDPSSECPREHARRGMVSWKKMVKALGWKEENVTEASGEIQRASL